MKKSDLSRCSLSYAWILVILSVLAGCRTASPLVPLNTSEPGWKVQNGQAIWKPSRSAMELAGDLVIARHPDGRCFINFSKTPFPVVTAQTFADAWAIEFSGQRHRFLGKNPPPLRLGWLYLPRALAAQPLPKEFEFQNNPDNHWYLTNRATGESIAGYLSP